jgi:lysophospholipase L1-like esterase
MKIGMRELLAIGDCNTRGDREMFNAGYPEQLGRQLGLQVVNRGYTMSSTREGVRLFDDCFNSNTALVTVQFGLVDSWITVAHSPYVLYYPDNVFRKIARKLAKKYKKLARKAGLGKILGLENVVPIEEYRFNLEHILRAAGAVPVLLIETVPNEQEHRNPEIRRYNRVLEELAGQYANAHRVAVYDQFYGRLGEFMQDGTHINERGYRVVMDALAQACDSLQIPRHPEARQ